MSLLPFPRASALAFVAMVLILGSSPLRAQRSATGPMPVKVVAGRLVARCDVVTRVRRIPANLLVEFDSPCGLTLHNQAASALGVDEGAGPIKLEFPELQIQVDQREQADQEFLEEFTKLHSIEMGEIAMIGRIGAHIFKDYGVALDLAAGLIELSANQERREVPPPPESGTVRLPVSVANDVVWLPVRHSKGQSGVVALGTSSYDTRIDRKLCERLGKPAGDIGAINADAIDLANYVAWRPSTLRRQHADGALGAFGINLLLHLRVEVDRVNGFVTLRETRPAKFPTADREFFAAEAEGEAEELENWLERYPKERLASEGAELLVDLRIDDGSDAETFERAIRWFDRTRVKDLRATEALRLLEKLRGAGRPELASVAGKIGVEGGRGDRYPDAVHKLHSQLGDILLAQGEEREARRHLLSAAFGTPDDGLVNLNLGRFYEARKRYRRAFSRYVQAVIRPETAARALQGLDRVQRALGATQAISVDEIDRLIAGKILGFGAANRFEAPKTNRVVVAELFTNADIKRGALAGILAFEGLQSHFPAERLIILSYHLPNPKLIPLVSAASVNAARGYETGPLRAWINGIRRMPGGARKSDREKLYDELRSAVAEEMRTKSKYDVSIEATLKGDELSGRVVVKGPERRDLRVELLLAERKLLYPGISEAVIHRMVVRANLLARKDGVAYEPENGAMNVPLKASLKKLEARNLAFLDRASGGQGPRFGARFDLRQMVVVALVRDHASFEIVQASSLHLKPE